MNPLLAFNRAGHAARLFAVANVLGLGLAIPAYAILADPRPREITQPDGTKVTLRLRGDEYFHWTEDTNGFTVVLQNGRYVYAQLDAENRLVPSDWQAGTVNPRTVGLAPGVLPPRELRPSNPYRESKPYRPWLAGQGIAAQGTVKNLVILCKFSDHTFGVHTRAEGDYNILFNQVGGHPELAPTGSVRDVYTENSYGIVTLESTVAAWVTLPQTQAYYAGTNNGLGTGYPHNAQKMVEDALAAVDPLVNFGLFDTDNDGYIDAITILHSGYGAEALPTAPDRIWSHYSLLSNDWTSADNNGNGVKVKVKPYHTEPALWSVTGTNITHIGVISHETGHFFGLPNLYDEDNSSYGLAEWCMMADSWGFTLDQLYPPHFSAWCKIFLGWTTPTLATSSGTFTLVQTETAPSAVKITRGFPAGEYLLVENRQTVGMDINMPAGGLAIYHVDENVATNSNEGFEGQPGWPANGNHYKVAMVQADGLFELEQINLLTSQNGDEGDLYRAGGPARLAMSTLPNTGTYQGGVVVPTFNVLSQFSAPGPSMTFHYSRGLYVDKFYGGAITDGSWLHPYKHVTNAYAAAVNGDTIVIRAGDYVETPMNNLTKQVTLDSWLGTAAIR